MAPSSASGPATTSVQVALRIRPTTPQDAVSIPTRFQRSVLHATSSTSVSVDAVTTAPGTPTAAAAPTPKKQAFNFDQVHGPSATQYDLYTSTAKPLISRFVEGYNCTILAYGQTSSGKTFTMTGVDLDADPSDPDTGMGIIPRSVSHIFSETKSLKEERGDTVNFSVKGSFIEIYNEDLIDLLSMDDGSGGKREVQIREDKNGQIIWGGVREVPVKNTNDVMRLLRQGTSIRRTNETDMNAQSSRSHAIFSLTLTQKKFTGSGAPPRSSSPQPGNGRSPSRLARPGSTYGPSSVGTSRMASPTFGRPATPSFAAAMGRGGLRRPSSSLGINTDNRPSMDDDAGEWVTVVSKFHFVDLAGSERIKRTAAVGERVKEGISINSGLLALGNVISALGDSSRAKSHTATHIPYRDSKLTRLLQDSLGGNTQTLMIACVSPAEYNAAETINTLKYANRARNIKNKAVINEREEGWDDLEWLQGTVTRLRKEMKSLKDGGAMPPSGEPSSTETRSTETRDAAAKTYLAQLNNLQGNYESLRTKFVERTEELTRLRQELGEKHRGSSSGSLTGAAKYEEIVGPVIEEYEKTIESMEAALSLNQAALRHTNDLVEEKEEELSALNDKHSATEMYLEELKNRATKLQEREASTEAYVHDLEEKIRSHEETSMTSSESMSDLKREVTRFKETESHSIAYIAELESRLAKADESVLSLQQTTERLERECDRRRTEVEILQTRLETLRQDGDGWRMELDQREKKVQMLEKQMEEWQRKKQDAGDARDRLGAVAARARRSLSVETDTTQDTLPVGDGPTSSADGSDTPDATDGEPDKSSAKEQLITLQQTHTATLADLTSISAKYRDALREISDLAAQIQEAKLSNSGPVDTQEEKTHLDMPISRRRMTSRNREMSEPQMNAQGRRLFFRQAASTESLHSRSLSQSQSLSQELSSARSRNTSFSSHGASSSISHSPLSAHSPSPSYSRPSLSISLPGTLNISSGERSVTSLQKEVMRLQEVLKEREAEISVLESSMNALRNGLETGVVPVEKVNGHHYPETPKAESGGSPSLARAHVSSPSAASEASHGSSESGASGNNLSDADKSLVRLNELMLSMAQKESQHREIVDDLNNQLSTIRRQHDDLTALSRDQTANMSSEIEALHETYASNLAALEETKKKEEELLQTLKTLETTHLEAIDSMAKEHTAALSQKDTELTQPLAQLTEKHKSVVDALEKDIEASKESLRLAKEEHESSLGKLRADHEQLVAAQKRESEEAISSLRAEHSAAIASLQAEHANILKQREMESSTTEEEYYDALTKVRQDHAQSLEKQVKEHSQVLESLREEHAREIKTREIAQEGMMSESQSSQATAISNLQNEHAAALSRKEAALMKEIEQVKGDHERFIATKEEDFRIAQSKLRAENERVANQLREELRSEVEKLQTSLAAKEAEAQASAEKITTQDASLTESLANYQQLQEKEHSAREEIAKLLESHKDALVSQGNESEAKLRNLVEEHATLLESLRADHDKLKADSASELAAVQEQHRIELERAGQATKDLAALQERHRDEQESSLAAELILASEKARSAKSLDDLQEEFTKARSELQEERDALMKELETHKSSHQELTASRSELVGVHEEALRQRDEELRSFQDKLENALSEQRADLHAERELLSQELETHRARADEVSVLLQEEHSRHKAIVLQRDEEAQSLQSRVDAETQEKQQLEATLATLREELDNTRNEQSRLAQEASNRDSLLGELEKHRSMTAELQEDLQKAKDQNDTLHMEKSRQDHLVRELQAQVARAASPPITRNAQRPGASASKLPPPTPPPSMPPPPLPRSMNHSIDQTFSTSSQSSAMTSTSSRDSQSESSNTSMGHASLNGAAPDSKMLESQAKQIEEQEAMIKTLNKQLTHCETDLQTHMDIVSTLETSLGDSEKNLRKARMQATELARERDTLNAKLEALRVELAEAKREVVSVRRSVVEEKQSLEQRLDEERKAKERARAQLDSRMDELTKRKSKFACL